MTRRALVTLIANTINQHRLDGFTSGELAVAIIDKAEPLIRADERERITHNVTAEWAEAVHDYRADLRAKVEALASLQMRRPDDVYDRYCLLRDVLALFDGAE